MGKRFAILILLAIFTIAPAAVYADIFSGVGFAPQNVWFSKDPFFADDNVTIFAFLANCHEEEVRGDVEFLDNGELIAERTFSLRGNCQTTTVSVPWVVPEGERSVSARITRAVIANTGEEIALERNTLGEVSRTAVRRDTNQDDISGVGTSTPFAQKLVETFQNTTEKFTVGTTTTEIAQKSAAILENFRVNNAERMREVSGSLAQKRTERLARTPENKDATPERIQDILLAGAQLASVGLAYILDIKFLFYALLAIIVFFAGRYGFRRLRAMVRGRPD